jgi:hypothetical protein
MTLQMKTFSLENEKCTYTITKTTDEGELLLTETWDTADYEEEKTSRKWRCRKRQDGIWEHRHIPGDKWREFSSYSGIVPHLDEVLGPRKVAEPKCGRFTRVKVNE